MRLRKNMFGSWNCIFVKVLIIFIWKTKIDESATLETQKNGFGVLGEDAIFNVNKSNQEQQDINTSNTNDTVTSKLLPLNLDLDSVWSYVCNAGHCIKEKSSQHLKRVSLDTCNMMCSLPLIWPRPTRLRVSRNGSAPFNRNHIGIKMNAPDKVKADLKSAIMIFMTNLPVERKRLREKHVLQIHLIVDDEDSRPQIATDESYSLITKKVHGASLAVISAASYFGARNGLETLSQLIWFDTQEQTTKILLDVDIYDRPTFPHRGLMIDTARNFFPVSQLMKVLDGMAASKLNVLHLHLTDSISFPILLPNNPQFARYGAYSPQMIYTPDNIIELIEYARIRGIRVILEIDAPSHVNEGWNRIKNEEPDENNDDENEDYENDEDDLIICGKEDVLNGHLNPDNKNVQPILKSIYKDLLQLGSDRDTFHVGGDEIDIKCWSGIKATAGYQDVYYFWAEFINKMLDTVKEANNGEIPENTVLWSSSLTEKKLQLLNYPENVAIQYTKGDIHHYFNANHKLIFSGMDHWYLDCGFGPWKSTMESVECNSYIPWQTFYKYRPWSMYPNHLSNVLGGEICLWTEQVGVDCLETKIWPRAAAAAERLWSDPPTFKNDDVYQRLANHRERLLKRGIKAAALWPRWCYQNPGKC